MYEFTVPEGDWTFNSHGYEYRDLVFQVYSKKEAFQTAKDYAKDGVAFTLVFIPKVKE